MLKFLINKSPMELPSDLTYQGWYVHFIKSIDAQAKCMRGWKDACGYHFYKFLTNKAKYVDKAKDLDAYAKKQQHQAYRAPVMYEDDYILLYFGEYAVHGVEYRCEDKCGEVQQVIIPSEFFWKFNPPNYGLVLKLKRSLWPKAERLLKAQRATWGY